MNAILREILNSALSDDIQISSEAILNLGCILEMHSWKLSLEKREHRFTDIIGQEIIEIFLDDKELSAIVVFLANEMENKNKSMISFSLL